MATSPQYQPLPTEEVDHEENTPTMSETTTPSDAPPSYEEQEAQGAVGAAEDLPPPKPDWMAPPAYDVATKLPTYEEVQQQKQAEQQPGSSRSSRRLALFQLDLEESGGEVREDALLGTDYIFFIAFCVAFLFNWVGFLLLLCLCHTVAGRYGALAGFGLSLAKWTLIVKHSTALVSQDNAWLYWLIMGCGVLICVRAILQYLRIKQEWAALSRHAQERLLFFY